jgi:excisionase family DNA binding protein
MKATAARPAPGLPKILSVAQAAEYLHVRPKRVLEQVKEGRLPATRLGRRIYILEDELAAMVRAGTEMPKTGGKTK